MGVKYKEMFSYAQRSSYFEAILGLRKFLLKANTVENCIKGLNGIVNYFLDLASKNVTTTTVTLPQDANKSKFKFV